MFVTAQPIVWTFRCSVQRFVQTGDVGAGDYGWAERCLRFFWQTIGSPTKSIPLCADRSAELVENKPAEQGLKRNERHCQKRISGGSFFWLAAVESGVYTNELALPKGNWGRFCNGDRLAQQQGADLPCGFL